MQTKGPISNTVGRVILASFNVPDLRSKFNLNNLNFSKTTSQHLSQYEQEGHWYFSFEISCEPGSSMHNRTLYQTSTDQVGSAKSYIN